MNEPTTEQPDYLVRIDGLEYRIASPVLTTAEIRALPHPPIGADRDLWLVRQDGSDEFLTDEEQVVVADDASIFTAPRAINPGRRAY